MKMDVTAIVNHALGYWPCILPVLGIQVLKNRHQPRPVCGESDRFRFDDREGRDTWHCNQCGVDDSLKLVEKMLGVSPSDAVAKAVAVTGSLLPADPTVTAAVGAETDAARKNAAALAQTPMAKTRPGIDNVYLIRKGFPGREYRVLTGTHRAGGVSWRVGDLVVPLYDDSGEPVNFQSISADGHKRTLESGQVRGTCHTLEGQNQAGKRLWIAEGYATALIVHHLTGETVVVAFSFVSLLSLTSLVRQKHPACQIVLTADRDLSGGGQTKATVAADACEGVVALPPVFGDWNDALTQCGGGAIRKVIYDTIRLPAENPFDTMSETEFSATSISEKTMRIYEHYGEALVVDANGQLLSRYENGVWGVLPPQDFSRDVAGLFQRLRVPFFSEKMAFVVDALKLIAPQQGAPSHRLIGFRNDVFDTQNDTFHPHSPSHWMCTLYDVDFAPLMNDETLETHVPAFWCWLDRAAGGRAEKRDVILVALLMVLANRYDWRLFLEVIGPGGSGKGTMVEITTLSTGEDNAISAIIEMLESLRERAALTGFSLIRLSSQEEWSGDDTRLKAITGSDAVPVDPKYWDACPTHIPAVILAVSNNPIRFTDRSGGVSRRRVIVHSPEQIAPQECDPQFKDKITRELAVIMRHLTQKFSDPMLARSLLQPQQNSDEVLNIKRDADPTSDPIGYLETLPQTSGMYMGNASVIPRNYHRYLYHAYLAYTEANDYWNVPSLRILGLGLPVMLKEYGPNYKKRHARQGIQTNLTLKGESHGDRLLKCDDPVTAWPI